MSDVSNAAILEYLEQFSATTAESFQKVEARLDRVEARLDGLETRVTSLETRVRGLDSRMDRLEDAVRAGFLGVNERLQRLEAA